MSDLYAILRALIKTEAKFVVVGGVAMQLHGSAYLTNDVDFVYERTSENGNRIVAALRGFGPRPRGFPPDLSFIFDVQTLIVTEILTLETTAGPIDLLAMLKGVGNYKAVEETSQLFPFEGSSIRALSIDGLIAAKEAAGRPKDKAGVIELRALKELTEK